MELLLRPYRPSDAEALVQLFTETVHRVNRQDYTQAQCDAWAPRPYDLHAWEQRLTHTQPLIAELDRVIVGFGELEADGHIDAFYVHAQYQGCGVGARLLHALEQQATRQQISRLYAEVSTTARPFFQSHGFHVLAEQAVSVLGVTMTNYRMEKQLT
jgi:GNAT superfamily N-acetyltransferase